jgi:hypothetical protein
MKRILNLSILIAIIALSTGVANAQATHDIPDPGTTSALVMVGLAGLVILRRFIR